MPKIKAILLFSGGLDSTYALDNLHKKFSLHCFHVAYNHTASQAELKATKTLSTLYKVPLQVEKFHFEKLKTTYIPIRNLTFLTLAAQYAVKHKIKVIFFTPDHVSVAPADKRVVLSLDQSSEFVLHAKAILNIYGIQLRLFGNTTLRKNKLSRLSDKAKKFISYCYKPKNGKPCGDCGNCVLHNFLM